MSSSLYVPVATIDALEPHSNADTLELATILGWQLIVKKGEYQVGDKITYFPPDTMLSPELSDRFGVTDYLSHGRVRCVKLRGEPSFGLAVTPDDLTWEVGQDVSQFYEGVSKWEPPLRGTPSSRTLPEDCLPEHPLFPRYTSIENMRNYPDIFAIGEPVYVTEKIHGTNTRIGMVEGELMAGSHRMRRKAPESREECLKNPYWYPSTIPGVMHLLEALAACGHQQVVLYGEVYGSSIQSFHYGEQGTLGYRAFDLLIDGKYLDPYHFLVQCARHDVQVVPFYSSTPISFSLPRIKALSEGKTTLLPEEKAHIREGVVVKPLVERTDRRLGRVVLKYLSDTYLFDKKKTDYAEQ